MKKRLVVFDIMQGIAMVLVVLGHHKLKCMPEWYLGLFRYIYTFHMALFVFISGFLVRYSYKGVYGAAEYKEYVDKRFKKFVPPYLIVGILCSLITWNFKDIGVFINSVVNMIISPKESEATFLWYIYLLFIFYCIAPLIFNTKRYVKITLFIIALLLSLRNINISYFCIDYFARYFVFFLFGALVAKYYTRINMRVQRFLILFLCLFAILSVFSIINGGGFVLKYAMKWVCIPAFYYLSQLLVRCGVLRNVLTYVSVNCFGIYLLHMFFVQAGAMIITHLPWIIPSWGYVAYLLISTSVSIGGAVLIWSRFLRNN